MAFRVQGFTVWGFGFRFSIDGRTFGVFGIEVSSFGGSKFSGYIDGCTFGVFGIEVLCLGDRSFRGFVLGVQSFRGFVLGVRSFEVRGFWFVVLRFEDLGFVVSRFGVRLTVFRFRLGFGV